MKKQINGKMYDTEKAKEIGRWWNGQTGLGICMENLHRKRNGEFFLYGEGGPMSKYAKFIDHSNQTSSEKIMPLSYNEAMKWAEEYLSGEEYEAIFGEIEEDETKCIVTYSLQADTLEKIKRLAAQKELTQSALIDNIIAAL